MAKKKKVDWFAWSRYYLGRILQVLGLLLTSWSIVLYFGSSDMRRMLELTGFGAVLFVPGWLLSKKDPRKKDRKKKPKKVDP